MSSQSKYRQLVVLLARARYSTKPKNNACNKCWAHYYFMHERSTSIDLEDSIIEPHMSNLIKSHGSGDQEEDTVVFIDRNNCS